jgi:hypothetical protein
MSESNYLDGYENAKTLKLDLSVPATFTYISKPARGKCSGWGECNKIYSNDDARRWAMKMTEYPEISVPAKKEQERIDLWRQLEEELTNDILGETKTTKSANKK